MKANNMKIKMFVVLTYIVHNKVDMILIFLQKIIKFMFYKGFSHACICIHYTLNTVGQNYF